MLKSLFKIIKKSFVCIIFLTPILGRAGDAQDILQAFDWICISTDAKIVTIEKMAKSSGAKKLPPEALAWDQAIAVHGGNGYAFKINSLRFGVAVTKIGTCAIAIPLNTQKFEIIQIFEKNYLLTKPFIEESGPQIRYFYKIIEPSIYAGGFLFFIFPKPEFLQGGFVVGYISEKAKSFAK